MITHIYFNTPLLTRLPPAHNIRTSQYIMSPYFNCNCIYNTLFLILPLILTSLHFIYGTEEWFGFAVTLLCDISEIALDMWDTVTATCTEWFSNSHTWRWHSTCRNMQRVSFNIRMYSENLRCAVRLSEVPLILSSMHHGMAHIKIIALTASALLVVRPSVQSVGGGLLSYTVSKGHCSSHRNTASGWRLSG
jgi:hypothetical protein